MNPPSFTVSVCTSEQDKSDAFAVRKEVFVREQQVPMELEADRYDHDALHLIARAANGDAVGTLRIVDKGNRTAKIGRVATLAAFRGQGIGSALMRLALELVVQRGFATVVLDAQLPVISFYEHRGFMVEGPEFEDAGIRHRRMVRAASGTNPTDRI